MSRIDKLKKLILENPEDSFILFALAKEYEMLQKYNIAIEYYNRILDIDTSNLSAYYNLGLLLEQSRNTKEAKKIFETGLVYAKRDMDFEYINYLTLKLNSSI